MGLLFKFSFIVSGIFLRDFIYYDTMQVSEIFLLIFVAVTIFQYLYVFIFYKRDGEETSHGACLARWIFCYTVTAEATVVITAVMNFSYRYGMAHFLSTPHPESYKFIIVISTCIVFQVFYAVIKSRKR
jgi:hypothetical protein